MGAFERDRGPVRLRLEQRIASAALRPDDGQRRLADRLDRLGAELRDAELSSKKSALGWLFGSRRPPAPVVGVYIHGGVGRGKSMLMDLFFATLPLKRKRRVHFHAFMGEVHERIGRHRDQVKAGTARGDDPMPPVAADIAAEARLLCFDEFAVSDVADAMILSRLFDALFAEGLTLVATSNVAPNDLYRDGLNRPLFLPFVERLKSHADIVRLDAPTDYRLEGLGGSDLYVWPLGPAAASRMDAIWVALLAGSPEAPTEIRRKGRVLTVARSGNGAARFGFDELLVRPLAADDYLALARRFHTILVEDVPVMGQAERNEAKRFIALVDTLYDAGRRIAVSAAAPETELYRGRSGSEAFEFARTASRLHEMRSFDYLAAAGPAAPEHADLG